jgi:phosphonate transport system permease protein
MDRHPPKPARRGLILLGIGLLGILAAFLLGLGPGGLVPNAGGLELARRFFAAALEPAWTREAASLAPHSAPFLVELAHAALRTLVFAAAAMSLSILVGLPLGIVASDTWWRRSSFAASRITPAARALQVGVRLWIALMRSVHELIWAVVLLAAMGLNTFGAVLAIAIPYAGTLAKVFSEMLDEAPRHSAKALEGIGVRPLGVFLFGLVPRALPDMIAYTAYRFECAVRSAAVLGFFGYPTLGYHLSLSFGDGRFHEAWTTIYLLLALILFLEWWSTAIRRRLVS